MTRTRFGKTLKAFSFAAAIFAGTLGAGLCGSLFASCENMGGDVSSALLLPQPTGGSGTRAASKKVGRGRVTGNISQSPDVAASTVFCASSDSGMSADVAASCALSQPADSSASDALISKSVLPDMSDVTIASYDVSAWGTKADGTVVPKTSPVHGTAVVAPTGADFTLELDYGNWFVRADALDSGGKIVLSQTQDNVEVNDDSPVVSLAFKVSYYQEAGVTGSFALPISLDPSLGIANVIYRMTSADGSVDIDGTYGVTGLSSFVLDSTKSGSFATVAPGNCDLVIEFYDALDGLVMRIDQAVQIYSNVTTKKIDGTAPYINTSGGGAAINITSDVMKKYKDTVVYVGGTGASDTNNGTRFDPVETMGRALQILDASAELGMSPATGFTIYVNGDVSLTASVTLDKTYKLSIIGRNTSAYYKIDGALTHGITASASDVSFSYINLNKIHGFDITGGQTTLKNCSITNGKARVDSTMTYASYGGGGGGICVKRNAKAVLTDCSISGCSAESGGAVYVRDDSESGIAEVALTRCVIGDDTRTSCASETSCSNKADGGGGIYINKFGKATLTDTKIIGNVATTGCGGAIYLNAGTLVISGGQINYNRSKLGGGAIYVGGFPTDLGALTIDDCVVGVEGASAAATGISDCGNCCETSGGGGIHLASSSTLTTTNGFSVLKNYSMGTSASDNGGGIRAMSDLTLDKCDISYNAAANNGGGIFNEGTLSLQGGTIAGNAAASDGGGVYLTGGAKLFMSGGAVIGDKNADSHADENHYSNKAANGGAIAIDKGEAYIGYTSATAKDDDFEGGIYYNYASGSGGGISLNDESANKLYCYKGTIDKNCGRYYGGAVAAGDAGEVQISKTAFNQNIAGFYGGAISIGNTSASAVKLALADATVEKNSVAKYDDGGYGGAIYAQYYNTLEISGSTYIPAGDASGATGNGKNDVYLEIGKTITIASALTSTTTPVATITPSSYSPGTAVLADSDGSGDLVQSELSKFAVTPDSGEEWTIGYNATSKTGVLSSAVIYVSGGSDGSDDDTVATGSSAKPYKTVAHALGKVAAPNCSIIIKESTTETEHLEITAAMAGLKIKSAGATAKTITGASGKEVKIYAASAKFENIALSAWDCVDVYDDVTGVKFTNVAVSDGHNGAAGGGVWIASGADVEAETLTVKDCYVDSNGSGGAIYVANGAKLAAKNLVIQDCHADGANANGGGVYNAGTLLLNKAQITGCAAGKKGGGIFNANNATLLLDGVCDIPSGIYLTGGATSGMTAAKPLYIKGSGFALASGADKIPLEPEIRTGTEEFQENSAVIKGWDPEDGSAAYEVTEAQVNCFVTAGTALGLEYDGTAAPPCGKLVDKSISGGITVDIGGNISFEIATPCASGEKARFNVIDNSSGTPIYVTPTSAQIKILQYGTPVYSADAQEVTATYLSEGEYELYCKAVVGGVTYDTTLPFGASGKYTPLTLEAAQAGAVVTFDNKASGPVTYRVNGGTEQTIASGATGTITLDNIGDKVQFFGDNAKYASSPYNNSNILCDKECYVYGNVMSIVDSDGFASADTLMGDFAFALLFYNNTKIKNKAGYDLLLPATTLKNSCYQGMFQGCKSLTSAPTLPATALKDSCYYAMLQNCTSLETAPELPAETLESNCYAGMFYGCTSLTTAPDLPAKNLASGCYWSMFGNCTSLTVAPDLPATTLAEKCYQTMFQDCTSLTAAPALPATTLADACYREMFRGCTSLATAPELPAMTMTDHCYTGLFYGCTSLTAAPALPATTLADYCYGIMFYECTNLTSVPEELPATTLAENCYYSMFCRCSKLEESPVLPAPTPVYCSYMYMFNGCSKLKKITCLATDISSDCTFHWVEGVFSTGTFTQAPGVDWSVKTGTDGIPAGWTVNGGGSGGAVTNATPLTIEAAVASATVTFKNKASGSVTYKLKDGTGDTIASNGSKTITLSAVGDTVQFFGDNTTYGTSGSDNSSRISCSADCYIYGNFMSLVNSTGYASANAVAANAFSYLFYTNTKIKNKAGYDLLLPATTLASSCYEGMFYGCSGLTKAPDLPATTLAEACYYKMFASCSALIASPELAAPTLVDTCYKLMFYECSNLTSITCLATNTSATGCTTNWVYNVSSTGTFTKANGMTWPTSSDGIPGSGWTVQDAP